MQDARVVLHTYTTQHNTTQQQASTAAATEREAERTIRMENVLLNRLPELHTGRGLFLLPVSPNPTHLLLAKYFTSLQTSYT